MHESISDCLFIVEQVISIVKGGEMDKAIEVLRGLNSLQSIYVFSHIEDGLTAREYDSLVNLISQNMN